MIWVFLAALAGGVAVLLQAQSARAEGHAGHLGLMATLVRRPRYVAGLACVLAGFLCGWMALRELPLFAVQAGRASSLAVTAVLAVWVLQAKLRGRDVAAIAGVGVGLVAVSIASQPGASDLALHGVGRWAPLVSTLVLLTLGQLVARSRSRAVGAVIAVASGLAFALVGLCVRGVAGVPLEQWGDVVRDPLLWTIPVAGFAGVHMSTVALTRTSLVAATSALIATETIAAAGLGLTLAGDRTREGLLLVAIVGVLLVVIGSLELARFGADPESPTTAPEDLAAPLGPPSSD